MIERHHLKFYPRYIAWAQFLKRPIRYLSSPAVTHAVKRLEHIAGIKLWKKKGRAIVLPRLGSF